jgi:hypothetical protein
MSLPTTTTSLALLVQSFSLQRKTPRHALHDRIRRHPDTLVLALNPLHLFVHLVTAGQLLFVQIFVKTVPL